MWENLRFYYVLYLFIFQVIACLQNQNLLNIFSSSTNVQFVVRNFLISSIFQMPPVSINQFVQTALYKKTILSIKLYTHLEITKEKIPQIVLTI